MTSTEERVAVRVIVGYILLHIIYAGISVMNRSMPVLYIYTVFACGAY